MLVLLLIVLPLTVRVIISWELLWNRHASALISLTFRPNFLPFCNGLQEFFHVNDQFSNCAVPLNGKVVTLGD